MRLWVKQYVRLFALWLLDWVDYCPSCGASWASHHCPIVERGTKVCEVCQQPLSANTHRTHDGKWLCAKHKVSREA